MFGGVWDASEAVAEAQLAAQDVAELGRAALDEIAATEPRADPATEAIVLWVGLHGLAHQRIVSKVFDWPDGVEETLVRRLIAG